MSTTISPDRLAALDTIALSPGSHPDFVDGHCAMEVVAWLANEGHTDAPECASLVLATFTITLNDRWDTATRQKLIPFLPRMVGTAGDGQDEARSYLALDWLIRTCAPAWLDFAGLTEEAEELRGLHRIVDLVAAQSAGPVVRAAREKAGAARDAAWDAPSAASDAPSAAASVAAKAAAWAAAWVAALAAAKAAAKAAALDAVSDAAWVAVLDAAWVAVWDAGKDALRTTVETLQASTLALLDRMIDPSKGRA